MQILYFPQWITILICFVLWPVYQFIGAFIALKMDKNQLDSNRSLYKTRNWEKDGYIYNHIFKVKKWKKYLPDGGGFLKNSFKKSKLENTSYENLQKYLIESCRAELTHWIAIIPFWTFGIFSPPRVIFYMFIYAIIANIPCIIVQRYNRPRIIKYLNAIKQRESIKEE